jgi:hypothetical protein
MPAKPSGPVRRAQAIAPFGVGAMVTVPGGTSLIMVGLDYWYQPPGSRDVELNVDEFKFNEWRLQNILGVDHFRLPPDYRDAWRTRDGVPNAYLTLPALRFPTWHFCHFCHLLAQKTLYERGVAGRIRCPDCERTSYMFQVPFVAMCEDGHLQDFPWREWVHRTASPTCNGPLRLKTTGSASLAGQMVSCDGCDVEPRSLSSITMANEKGTTLTRTLDESGAEYLCRGRKPWLGPEAADACTAHMRGALRNAMNVYYALIRSAIYLPPVQDRKLQELVDLFEKPPLSSLVNIFVNQPSDTIAQAAKSQQSKLLSDYDLGQITAAIEVIQNTRQDSGEHDYSEVEEPHSSFRHEEYVALRTERDEPNLLIRREPVAAYGVEISDYFAKLMLVDKLRETRALAGFTRVFPGTHKQADELRDLMVHETMDHPWLPAYIVYGEGLFFELDEKRLKAWEEQRAVKERAALLATRLARLHTERKLEARDVSPRLVLIHTLAHLLINQLTFDSGYSSASLRERLYASTDPRMPMAGLLIYTANGDSEGTMGGLVRMGKPGNIEPVIHKALVGAQWCSADPVCMEVGSSSGQGPDSCNLAACHNCALIPETACEEFNRFLDRAMVVGTPDDPELGFFKLG